MHRARVLMTTLPEETRAYSEAWLKERNVNHVAYGVGIAALRPRPHTAYVREVMADAVTEALRSGVDLATEAGEVRRRMMAAREHELASPFVVRK